MQGGGEGGQFVEALGEAEPGRAAVREQEAGPVGKLEIAPRYRHGAGRLRALYRDGGLVHHRAALHPANVGFSQLQVAP